MTVYVFFFFQAEDGIRDDLVTGVQTCALPIWVSPKTGLAKVSGVPQLFVALSGGQRANVSGRRSEERRVGKECRARVATYHEKKKDKKSKGSCSTGGRQKGYEVEMDGFDDSAS